MTTYKISYALLWLQTVRATLWKKLSMGKQSEKLFRGKFRPSFIRLTVRAV
jgi:hypothetical protein